MRITDSFLRGLKGDGRRRVLRDDSGLYVRVGSAGGRSFYARYRIDGIERWMKLGDYPDMSLADARAKFAKTRQDVRLAREGQVPDPAAAKAVARAERLAAPTVEQFAEEYICRHAKPNKKSWAEDKRQLELDVIPLIGQLKVRDVTKRHIVAVMDRIAHERKKPKQAGETLKVIRRMFNFAIERDVISINPCSGIKSPAKYEAKERVLSDSEIAGFQQALSASSMGMVLKDCILFQALTAVRPTEAREARWEEIDEEKLLWLIPRARTKMGRAHAVPLSEEAMQIIQRAKAYADGGGYLFPGEKEHQPLSKLACTRAIKRNQRLFEKFECGSFTPHDLRRTAATKIAELGHGLAVPHVLGHQQRSVTRLHYDHYDYLGEQRAALDAWAAHFLAMSQGGVGLVIPLKKIRGGSARAGRGE
jgi:integrase